MNGRLCKIFAGVGLLAISALASAQMSEEKEKPPMYSYVSFWSLPRAQWPEMEKPNPSNQKTLEKALAAGTLVGYGYDVNLVHQAEGSTHDSWWSSLSMAGALNVLEEFHKNGSAASPLLASATRHSDAVFVSRFYDWRPGTYKDAYTHGASYKLKPDAPNDAVATLSKGLFIPTLDKLLADGTIVEYEVDTEFVHTEAPGTFWVFYVTPTAEGLDKVSAAIRESLKMHPLSGPAFNSIVDFTPHRDYLARTTATFK